MSKVITDPKKIDTVLNRGTIVEILPSKKEFKQKLLSGNRLKFYIGLDATAPALHLGHAQNLIVLEKFRKLGHEVIVLFGDFTARIGDPTDKDSTRTQLSKEEVDANVKKWKKIIKPLLDFNDKSNPPVIKYNSKWLAQLNFEELIDIASNFTVQQMLERDMYEKRMKKGKPIHLHEFFYPLMQGYDSVEMEVDVELCGTDQIFNALAGRTLLKKLKGKDKLVVATGLIQNPKTGELMSKSTGTGIFLDATPTDLFGQIMSLPDEMIKPIITHVTLMPLNEINKLDIQNNPRDSKIKLAHEITKMIHGENQAAKAQNEFVKVFAKKEAPTDIPEHELKLASCQLLDLINKLKLIPSKAEGRRLIKQGAVRINNEKKKDWNEKIKVESGMVIQVGKRKFAKIK